MTTQTCAPPVSQLVLPAPCRLRLSWQPRGSKTRRSAWVRLLENEFQVHESFITGFSACDRIWRITWGFAAMLVEEAHLASQLSHPNVVSILDFARDTERRPYLIISSWPPGHRHCPRYFCGSFYKPMATDGRRPRSTSTSLVDAPLRGCDHAPEAPGGVVVGEHPAGVHSVKT
jgi:hypothetical protein